LFNAKSFFLFLILFTFIGCLQLSAQSIQNDSSTPIETQADLGFLDILGGDMQYHLNGQKIVHYKDFKNLIYPLHDPETSQLIRDAESTDLASWLILTTGVALSTDIVLFYKPAVIFNSNVPDRIITGLVTVQIGLGIYFIVHNIAEGRKYNAVQHYNHLIRKQPEEGSIELNPKLYACSNGLVLSGQLSF
jgi:hypothetical protein